jgi:Peptidase family M28
MLGAWVYSPPAPRPADIPANEFSAERARGILKDLVGSGKPHPMGSRENGQVRDRILHYFHEFGYSPRLRPYTVKTEKNDHARVENILAKKEGSNPGRAILLAAHYDSVDAGPGASDDGASVAVLLEIARMLQALPAPRNDVIFLIDDGEELGLFGAKSFVDNDPWKSECRVAINLEARGTSGKSLLFELSDPNEWLVAEYAKHVSRPASSSLYTEVYKRLPNDTDFTVFKVNELQGYNFAFIRSAQNYHTANDNLENADLGSLQNQGDNAWQLLRTLCDADLDAKSEENAVYTDVFGQFVIWWPEHLDLNLAVLILFATIAAATIASNRKLIPRLQIRTVVTVPMELAVALATGWLATRLLGRSSMSSDWPDWPWPRIIFYWLAATSAGFTLIRFTRLGRVNAWSAWAGGWIYWNLVGLLSARYAPGVSYLFLIPGGVAALLGIIAAALPKSAANAGLLVICCLCSIAAAVLWLPLQVLFYDAVGFNQAIVYPLCAALMTLTVFPMFCANPGTDALTSTPAPAAPTD